MGWTAGILGGIGAGILAGGMTGLGAGIGGLGNLGGLIGRMLSGIGSALLSGLGNLLRGSLSAVLRGALGVLSGAGKLAGGVLGALSSSALALSRVFGGALQFSLRGLTTGAQMLAGVLGRAVSSTSDWGRAIRDVSGATGMSNGTAGAIGARFGSMGLDAGSLLSDVNPTLLNMRASMWGLPGIQNAGFLPSAAARYQGMMSQGGMMGPVMARQLAASLGLDTAEGRRALSTPTGEIAAQQNFATSTNARFGLDYRQMADAQRHWEQLGARANIVTQALGARLSMEVLPYLSRGLNILTDIASAHAGSLGRLIERGVTGFVGGVGVSFNALQSVGNYLQRDLPLGALRFADSMLAGIDATLAGVQPLFGSFLQGINGVQSLVTPLFDRIMGGFNWLAQAVPPMVESVFSGILRGVNALQAGVGAFTAQLPAIGRALTGVFNSLASHPLIARVLTAMPVVAPLLEAGANVGAHAQNMASNMGASDPWAAAIGLAAPALLLRAVLGGGGGGMGRLLGGAATVGGGAYLMTNLLGGGSERNSWMQMYQSPEFAALAAQNRSGATGVPVGAQAGAGAGVGGAASSGYLGQLRQSGSAILNAMSGAFNVPSAFTLPAMPNLHGIGSGLLDQARNAPMGSWAAGLDAGAGEALRRNVLRGRSAIGQERHELTNLVAQLETQKSGPTEGEAEIIRLLKQLLAPAQQTARNTGSTADNTSGSAERVVARAIAYAGESAFLAGSRVGG